MASVPVASIWWIGLKRPPNRPVCGPLLSSGMPSANTLPARIRRAALTISSGVTWLSVPMWSSLPQRPQFLSFSVASAIACLLTLMFMCRVLSLLSRDGLEADRTDCHKSNGRGCADPSQRLQNPPRRERHVRERLGAKRAQRIVDGIHDRTGRAGGAGFARALGAELGIGGRSHHVADFDVGHLRRHRHEIVRHVAVEQ